MELLGRERVICGGDYFSAYFADVRPNRVDCGRSGDNQTAGLSRPPQAQHSGLFSLNSSFFGASLHMIKFLIGTTAMDFLRVTMAQRIIKVVMHEEAHSLFDLPVPEAVDRDHGHRAQLRRLLVHVPAILAGARPPVISDDGYVTMGGPDEATYYVTECGPAWHRTPGRSRG